MCEQSRETWQTSLFASEHLETFVKVLLPQRERCRRHVGLVSSLAPRAIRDLQSATSRIAQNMEISTITFASYAYCSPWRRNSRVSGARGIGYHESRLSRFPRGGPPISLPPPRPWVTGPVRPFLSFTYWGQKEHFSEYVAMRYERERDNGWDTADWFWWTVRFYTWRFLPLPYPSR